MRTASKFDGNALAGLLATVAGGDVTTMTIECDACGAAGVLAEVTVERDAVASIVRCRSCTHTLFTVLERDGRVRVVVGAVQAVEVEPTEE